MIKKVFILVVISCLLWSCKTNKTLELETENPLFSGLPLVFGSTANGNSDSGNQETYLYIHKINTPSFQSEEWIVIGQVNAEGKAIANSTKIYKIISGQPGLQLEEHVPIKFTDTIDVLQPESFQILKQNALRKKGGCTIFLKESRPDNYIGSTLGSTCRNRFRGSVYERTEMRIQQDTVRIRRQGFDEYDRHIWGPKNSSNTFIKLKLSDGH